MPALLWKDPDCGLGVQRRPQLCQRQREANVETSVGSMSQAPMATAGTFEARIGGTRFRPEHVWMFLTGSTGQWILLTFENALFNCCYYGCKDEFLTTHPLTHSLIALNLGSSLLLANG